MKPHQSHYRVYFEDTDQLGVVYHANFLKYYERARCDMWRDNGFYLTTMSEYGTYFAIYEANIRYHKPAYLEDHLNVSTSINELKACSIFFKQSIRNQNDILLSDAVIQVVCIDKQMKPKRIPNSLRIACHEE